MFLDGLDLAAAVGAGILIRFEVEITYTDGRFHIPVLGKDPGIPVADTHTGSPTLVTFVLRSQELDVRYVVQQVWYMQPDKMFVEGFAEPVTQFGMNAQMFQGLAVAAVVLFSVERIQADFGFQAPVTGQANFGTQVKCSRTPTWDIRF